MSPTTDQQDAVLARGNVLVMAGAGTGKTSTLVERCVNCLGDTARPASLEDLLVVTFTEAAAADVSRRIREELERRAGQSGEDHWKEQLALFDNASIGTLHSFCFKLVQQHFHELGLDPQSAVLDEGQARLMANETLAAVLQDHYAARSEAAESVRHLIQTQAGGQDKVIRTLVLRLHHYAQTRPDPGDWFAAQLEMFASPDPARWREWLDEGIADWFSHWKPALAALGAAGNGKAGELAKVLERLDGFATGLGDHEPTAVLGALASVPANFRPHHRDAPARRPALPVQAADVFNRIHVADADWRGKKTAWRPALKNFFDEAAFFASLTASSNDSDPLVEDWNWTRWPMTTLLRLAQEFSARFAETKREAGVMDFHDLEQFALQLLWDFGANQPTAIAHRWREKIRFVFVDEYQDINAAQDQIIAALSRTGANANRFLVGDVKQSIYRFRLADPQIFRNYAEHWRGERGTAIPLTENFRSREGVLQFVNSVFTLIMRSEVGGVTYDDEAKLRFGAPGERQAFSATADPSPRAELILRLKGGNQSAAETDEAAADLLAELEDAEKEARLVALRLRELQMSRHGVWDKDEHRFRPVAWRDMAVLLRAPANKVEGYAKEFTKLGVPLLVERGGFFQSTEITDLLSLLRALDNPLQDLPLLAALRSPLVGLSLDELAAIRLAAPGRFWTALGRWRPGGSHGARAGEQQWLHFEGFDAPRNTPPASQDETARKVQLFRDRFRRWRRLARQASLSRCLETVLAETHYADWLLAQERGGQRHANVQKFLGLAQHFDQFQRQGLFRFLRFIEAQEEAEIEPDVAPNPEQDAVRLMSIHQSKGLEFPVVVVADLGKAFNEQDLRAEIILDEAYGLCPLIKPSHSGRRYPSLPWWLAQLRQRRELRGEELRLFYVAMTRARDTLILIGSISAKKWEQHWQQPGDVTPKSILAAQNYADWLGLWFAQNAPPPEGANAGEAPFLRWSLHEDGRLVTLETETEGTIHNAEAFALDAATERKLRWMLAWTYPFGAATQRGAKTSVTALRRQAAERDEEAQPLHTAASSSTLSDFRGRGRERLLRPRSELPAADIGLAHHKFLEHIAIEKALDAASLQCEAQRLERERVLSPEEAAALDFGALAAFWATEIGGKIRSAASCVRRELAFTARFSLQELAAITGEELDPNMDGEFVVVQGVADLVVLLPREIWLVDFKTDEAKPAELAAKARLYEPQLKLYAHALSRIYERPVTECWLHFLATERPVRIKV